MRIFFKLAVLCCLALVSGTSVSTNRNGFTADVDTTCQQGIAVETIDSIIYAPGCTDKATSGYACGNDSISTIEGAHEPKDSIHDTKSASGFEPYPGFVLIRDYVPDVIEEIRYFTTNNFMGERADGYEANVAIASKQAAIQLKEVADELRPMGYVIKIFDAYRPQSAVDHFVRWSKTGDQRNKADYYPNLAKSSLFPTYIARKSGHSKGSTFDMTICYKDTGIEVDMGSHFDYFGQASHTMFLGKYSGGTVTKEHQKNRLLLRRVMEKHGFSPYDNEWWHFTLKNQPYPKTYFNFPVTDH